MKHFKRQHLAILPLLSILSMSPGAVESHFAERHIASVTEEVKVEVKGHPKLEVLVSKVDPKSLLKDRGLDKEKLRLKGDELIAKVKKAREEFKKDQSDKVVVEEQRKSVEAIVIDLLLVENAVKELDEKKALQPEDKEAAEKSVLAQKDIIESLLTDLEINEQLVAKASEPKVEEPKKEEEKPVVAEEPKKEEPKKEEEKPVVAEEPKKEEPKKEEEKKEVCESDEKNKVLTAQIEQLMKQQNQIMQTVLGMAQMMVSMHQQQSQQQPNPYYANGPGFNVQNPYQYNQPFTAGNWVYMPGGFQQNQQPNIFAQPMQQPQMQQYGIYPDQMHQQQPQSNWNLQPDPRFQYQPQIPSGTFGNNGLSFNMQNMVPTISQG